MDCFLPIELNEKCNALGGVDLVYAIPNKFITDVAIDANGHLTGITLDAGAVVTKFASFEDDDSSYFNQTQGEPGDPVVAEGYLKWNTLTKEKIEAANEAAGCCQGSTWIWFLNDGSVHAQGLDYNKELNKWGFAKKRALVGTNAMSNTSADKSHLDYTIKSTSTRMIACDETVIDEAYMDAL